MRFFSKIVFICNLCFLVFITLAYVELNNKKSGGNENIIPLPFVEGTFVVLGWLAIFLNMFFCLMYGIRRLRKLPEILPKWIVMANFMFLAFQFIYFLL